LALLDPFQSRVEGGEAVLQLKHLPLQILQHRHLLLLHRRLLLLPLQ